MLPESSRMNMRLGRNAPPAEAPSGTLEMSVGAAKAGWAAAQVASSPAAIRFVRVIFIGCSCGDLSGQDLNDCGRTARTERACGNAVMGLRRVGEPRRYPEVIFAFPAQLSRARRRAAVIVLAVAVLARLAVGLRAQAFDEERHDVSGRVGDA